MYHAFDPIYFLPPPTPFPFPCGLKKKLEEESEKNRVGGSMPFILIMRSAELVVCALCESPFYPRHQNSFIRSGDVVLNRPPFAARILPAIRNQRTSEENLSR